MMKLNKENLRRVWNEMEAEKWLNGNVFERHNGIIILSYIRGKFTEKSMWLEDFNCKGEKEIKENYLVLGYRYGSPIVIRKSILEKLNIDVKAQLYLEDKIYDGEVLNQNDKQPSYMQYDNFVDGIVYTIKFNKTGKVINFFNGNKGTLYKEVFLRGGALDRGFKETSIETLVSFK